MYDSAASWSASKAVGWNRKYGAKLCEISRTRRWKEIFPINKFVFLWNFLISFNARAPGLYLNLFFTGRVVIRRGVIFTGDIGNVAISSSSAPSRLKGRGWFGKNRWFPTLQPQIVCFILTMSSKHVQDFWCLRLSTYLDKKQRRKLLLLKANGG